MVCRLLIKLVLLQLSISICGCGFLRSASQETGLMFNRLVASNKRESSLDRIEKEEPEYLLDSVFGSRIGRKNPKQHQDETKARELMASADQLYQEGIQLRNQAQASGSKEHISTLVEAGKAYERAGEYWINSTVEQDALFKAGESYFFADYYKKANDLFERLVKYYEGTRYADALHARRFAIAQYWLELAKTEPQVPLTLNWTDQERPMNDTAGNAIRVLNRIRLDHPTGKIADDATLALANAYFDKERFMDAADTYEDLRINFPNSEHQFHAHLFELRSRLEAYQGPHYDGTHLDTADKLLKAIVSQFPGKAEGHQEVLTRENARIRKMKAEREMALASYYEARGAYEAAGLHYQQVRAEYQNTPLATDANERLAQISDRPKKTNEPPEWVAKLFPEPKPAEPLFGTSLKDQIR